MRRAPRRAKPCIMMKFVAAKTIYANYRNTSIVTASHTGYARGETRLRRGIAGGASRTGAVYWRHILTLHVGMRDVDRS